MNPYTFDPSLQRYAILAATQPYSPIVPMPPTDVVLVNRSVWGRPTPEPAKPADPARLGLYGLK